MSNISRQGNAQNRNLHDLRVNHGTGSVNLSALFTSGKELDIPILSFEDNIFPGSPCPTANLITPVPESPHMYEAGIEELLKKSFVNLNGEEEKVQLVDLDPSLEDSVDIDKLLNGQLIGEKSLEDIILNSKLSLDLEGQNSINLETGNGIVNNVEPVPSIKVRSLEPEYMQQDQIEGILGSERSNWQQIVTIKAEDLTGLSSCQEPALQIQAPSVPSALTPPTSPNPKSPASSLSSAPISPRGPLPRGRPGRKPSGAGPVRNNRKKQLSKDSEEYRDKRVRNNIAVRKSRDKAKIKQLETESRVEELVSENESLQKKVELLSKELNVLKSLFINVGASLPENFIKLLEKAS